MMSNVSKKNWKSLVAIAKTAREFSGKTGDSYDGRGYFPNKNMSNAVRSAEERDAKMQGKALVPKMESQYDNADELNKGTRYMDVPKKMIKHKLDIKVGKPGTTHFINTENKMKYIFGESKMKKSQFKQLIRGMVSDVLEGKGTAPGSPKGGGGGGSGFATPGAVSKGGFTLRDFAKILGGFGGGRTSKAGVQNVSKGLQPAVTKAAKQAKYSLFKGNEIDAWREKVLAGGAAYAKSKYQTTKSKTKTVSSKMSSLAAIRQTDNDFIKAAGGRKTGIASARMKVSAKYISQKSTAISQYTAIIDNEKKNLDSMLSTIVAGGGTGTNEHQALLNLKEDLDLRKAEYVLKWDYATAAYSGDKSGMENVRNSLETNKNSRMKRVKKVGSGTYSPVAAWSSGGKYQAGDIVSYGKSKYTAVGKGGWAEKAPTAPKQTVWSLNK